MEVYYVDSDSKFHYSIYFDERPTNDNDLSPEYQEIVADVIDNAIKSVRDSPELQEKFIAALTEEFDKDATCECMQKEINEMTQSVFDIKEHFESIRATLIKFDANRYRMVKADGRSGGDIIQPLKDKWDDFQKVSLYCYAWIIKH